MFAKSPVTGTVWSIEVSPGESVLKGQILMVVESMKMEIVVESPRAGVVEAIMCENGSSVHEGQSLVELAETD